MKRPLCLLAALLLAALCACGGAPSPAETAPPAAPARAALPDIVAPSATGPITPSVPESAAPGVELLPDQPAVPVSPTSPVTDSPISVELLNLD